MKLLNEVVETQLYTFLLATTTYVFISSIFSIWILFSHNSLVAHIEETHWTLITHKNLMRGCRSWKSRWAIGGRPAGDVTVSDRLIRVQKREACPRRAISIALFGEEIVMVFISEWATIWIRRVRLCEQMCTHTFLKCSVCLCVNVCVSGWPKAFHGNEKEER